eukprot:3029046-Lingulodinium_polyedra.AAC.1
MGQLPQDCLGRGGPILDFTLEWPMTCAIAPCACTSWWQRHLPAPVGREERDAAVVRDVAITIFRLGTNE